jgi:hypothetical protein
VPDAPVHVVVDKLHGAVHHQHVNAVRVHAPRGRLTAGAVRAARHPFVDHPGFAELFVQLVTSKHVVGAGVRAVGADVVADQAVGPRRAGADLSEGPDAAAVVGDQPGTQFLDGHQVRKPVVELLHGERLVEPGHAVAPDPLDDLLSALDVLARDAVGRRVPGFTRDESLVAHAAVDSVVASGKGGFRAVGRHHAIGVVGAVVRIAGALHRRQLGGPGAGVGRIGDRRAGIERRGQLLVAQIG